MVYFVVRKELYHRHLFMKDTITAEEFGKVYDHYSDPIFRHCYFRVYHRERAKELMQETFLHAWQYAVRGNEIQNIRALLYKIANNLIIDESRKKKDVSLDMLLADAGQRMEFSGAVAKFEPSVDTRETLFATIDGKHIIRMLEQLDVGDREVIVMRYIDGLPPKEIATLIGDTTNSVSVRLHRAVKKLRALLPP